MAKRNGTRTVTPTVTPTDGAAAWLLECTCDWHPKGMTKAIVRARPDGTPYPNSPERIHGHVKLAWSPEGALTMRMARPNVWRAEA